MSGYRRSPITRQLTEEEEALNERASGFLQSQSQAPRSFHSSGQRYAWMEKDLKMRSMQAGVLGQETRLAGELGDKRAMAAEDKMATDEEVAAKRGLEKVDQLVSSGMDYDEAVLKTSSELDLGLNEAFIGASGERSKLWMSPEEKASRSAKAKLEALQLTKETFDTEEQVKMIQEDPEGYKAALRGAMKAGQISAAAAPVAAKAKALLDRQALDEAEARAAKIRSFGDGSEDSLADLTYAFEEAGLGGVTNPQNVVKMFGGEGSKKVLLALSNKDFLEEKFDGNEEAATAFSKALNVLTDDSINAPESDKRQARSLVLSVAGEHNARMAQVERDRELSKSIEASNTELGNSFKDSSAAIDDILSDDKIRDKGAKVTSIAGAGRGFLDRFRALSTPGTEKIFDEYQAYFDKLSDPSGAYNEPEKAAAQARVLMGNFIKEFKTTQGKPADSSNKASSGTKNQNDAAMEWLKQNPDHPKAAAVRAKLGIK